MGVWNFSEDTSEFFKALTPVKSGKIGDIYEIVLELPGESTVTQKEDFIYQLERGAIPYISFISFIPIGGNEYDLKFALTEDVEANPIPVFLGIIYAISGLGATIFGWLGLREVRQTVEVKGISLFLILGAIVFVILKLRKK